MEQDITYKHYKAVELFEKMKTTPQSPIHHAEGDVYTHTQMVLNEVKSSYYSELLHHTALLHDVAKPLTTIFEDGDWRSPGHSKLGEAIAREILWDVLPFDKREEVCALIRFHGLPIWFDQKQNVDRAILGAALRCSMTDLADFAICDFKGRICNDLEDSLFKIELFREKAVELNMEFDSDWSRFSFFKRGTHPLAPIYPLSGAPFTLMVGLPGSGKNTWIHNNKKDEVVIELDTIRKRLKIPATDAKGQGTVIQEAKKVLKETLNKGTGVIWNATNLTVMQRDTLIDIASNYKAPIKIVYLDCSLDKAMKRNQTRPEADRIPNKVIEKMFNKLEIPTFAECHFLEIIN